MATMTTPATPEAENFLSEYFTLALNFYQKTVKDTSASDDAKALAETIGKVVFNNPQIVPDEQRAFVESLQRDDIWREVHRMKNDPSSVSPTELARTLAYIESNRSKLVPQPAPEAPPES